MEADRWIKQANNLVKKLKLASKHYLHLRKVEVKHLISKQCLVVEENWNPGRNCYTGKYLNYFIGWVILE